MRIRLFGLSWAVLCLVLTGTAFASEGADFRAHLDGAVAEGRITRDEALVNLFHFAFAPERIREDLRLPGAKPGKCLTPAILEFQEARDRLDPEAVALIDGYLRGTASPGKTAATYDSPDGLFTLTYETSGPDAVPLADIDPANGIPDYVEKVAGYCDSSWHKEIDELGFNAPNLNPGEKYQISFANLGYYGYTSPTGNGRSYIVLENDYIGFPGNSDPEGDQLGAAKVTVAHEFKHASQYNTNGAMAMGGWIELDAVWMEDIVFDESNDYIGYLSGGSGISDPDMSLDAGGSGSYEDCIWQINLSETFGNEICLEFMQRREAVPTETAKASYTEILAARGVDIADQFAEYASWNYLSGILANGDLPGYEEASLFPPSGVFETKLVYPDTTTGSIDRLATHVIKCRGLADQTGNLRVRFSGASTKQLRVVLLMWRKAAYGGGWFREDMVLDSTNTGDHTAGLPSVELKQIAVLLVHANRNGGAADYTLILENDDAATDVAVGTPVGPPFGLEQNRPNPFNPTTSIAFHLSRSAETRLVIYNSAGRTVRTLLGGEPLEAGSHTLRWDGRDDQGRDVGSGVYHYRLTAGKNAEAKRMILIR